MLTPLASPAAAVRGLWRLGSGHRDAVRALRHESCGLQRRVRMLNGGQEIRWHDYAGAADQPPTLEAALAQLANLERERRVADELLQIESLDLTSVLDRICQL